MPFREAPVTRDRVLAALGSYYVATGVAPFVSRAAFERVTGRKREWWLVQAVGALVTVTGATILAAARRERVTPEIVGLAAGCAGSLTAIDVIHVWRGRISPVYLADAAVEVTALAALVTAPRSAARPEVACSV